MFYNIFKRWTQFTRCPQAHALVAFLPEAEVSSSTTQASSWIPVLVDMFTSKDTVLIGQQRSRAFRAVVSRHDCHVSLSLTLMSFLCS